MILESVITCPICGFQKQEEMPESSCQYQYECTNCHTLLQTKPGDCCVFCSYGDYPCPPVQIAGGACCGASDCG
ncbi:MAG: GDCCVxC domain-containing (seleno)protein [Thiothrix sp.]|uniref:GDCCVxC domain-containing (seleno)protein n=1 Tax=Thiothrix sp. TaxID=1032 RepID=UPI002A49C5B0|nr:GDCCVxC domain-containing (seleno)protein [Thiothrix sp.]